MSGPRNQKTAYIETFGCQMNEYDSARMGGILAGLGYAPATGPDQADVILINTCSVRQLAEHKVYSYLGAIRGLKETNPDLIIGVTGCVAQQEGQRLLKKARHVDLVLGTRQVERLPEALAEALRGRRRTYLELEPREHIPSPTPIGLGPAPGLKAMLTIMTGCNNFCSYCVVPYVRGREKSRRAGDILEETVALVEAGVREITLLGQNVNSYQDPDQGMDFPGLLRRVAGTPGLWRLRFTTSHPKDLSPGLIEVMAGEEKVMEQLHLPAQHGSDRVLRAMNRGYTVAGYLEKVEALRRRCPDIVLGGDLIAGFPGETEQDHQASLELLDRVGFGFLFGFKYSDRPFTKAGQRADKIDEETKASRLEEIFARQRKISLDLHKQLQGSKLEVMVEGPAKKGRGLLVGRDRGGRAVNFPAPPALTGSIVQVEITEGRINSLLGRLVEAPEGGRP